MGECMVDFIHVYDVLTQARSKLFEWIRPLSQEQYTQEFPFGLHTLRATLIEIALVEWGLARRMGGDTAPLPEEWPISEKRQPTFADLETVWRELAARTRGTLEQITDWHSVIEWRVVRRGKTTLLRSATRAQIALNILFHEVHHRAQAMAMLRQLGVEAQNLDYILFVQQLREEPA